MFRLTMLWILEALHLIAPAHLRTQNCRDMPPPDKLLNDVVHIVGDPAAPKWATFQCPCGCGTPLLLSLATNRRPSWSVSRNWSLRPTIKPSVRRTDGCRAHFWVRDGIVDWCPDSGK